MTSVELLHHLRGHFVADSKSPSRWKERKCSKTLQFCFHSTAFILWLTMRETTTNVIYHVIEWKFQLKKKIVIFLCLPLKRRKTAGKFSPCHTWLALSESPSDNISSFSSWASFLLFFSKYRFYLCSLKHIMAQNLCFIPTN